GRGRSGGGGARGGLGAGEDGVHLSHGAMDAGARARAARGLSRRQAARSSRRRSRLGWIWPRPPSLVAGVGALRSEPGRGRHAREPLLRTVERCPVCDGDRLPPYAMDAWEPPALHFAQARCAGCGLLISQPQASESEMDAYYRRAYYEEQWPDPAAIFEQTARLYCRYELPLMARLWAD